MEIIRNYFSLKKLFIIICICICFIQIYSISSNYYSYPVIQEIKIEEPQQFEIPAFSYCVSKDGALNLSLFYESKDQWIHLIRNESDRLYENYNETVFINYNFQFYNFIDYLFQKFTLKQMKRFFYKPESILVTLEAFEKKITSGYYKRIKYDAKLVIIGNFMCYTYNPIENFTYNYDEIISKKAVLDWGFFQFSFKNGPTKLGYRKYVSVHTKNTYPRNNEGKYFFKYGTALPSYAIRMNRQLIHRLPAPYKTNCLDYKTLGFKSRYHALDDCSYNLSLKSSDNYICCNSLVDIDLVDDRLHAYIDFFNPHVDREEVFTNTCLTKYPQIDCFEERFILNLVEEYNGYRENIFFFAFYIPYFDTKSEATVKLNFIDYLAQLGSIIAFWFGLSVMNIGFMFTDLFTKLIHYKIILVKNQNTINIK